MDGLNALAPPADEPTTGAIGGVGTGVAGGALASGATTGANDAPVATGTADVAPRVEPSAAFTRCSSACRRAS